MVVFHWSLQNHEQWNLLVFLQFGPRAFVQSYAGLLLRDFSHSMTVLTRLSVVHFSLQGTFWNFVLRDGALILYTLLVVVLGLWKTVVPSLADNGTSFLSCLNVSDAAVQPRESLGVLCSMKRWNFFYHLCSLRWTARKPFSSPSVK